MTKIKSHLASWHIHPLLWIVLSIGVLTGSFTEMIVIFILIFIHEMGHFFMALFFRWRIKQVMFWPFGGVMETEEYFTRSYKEEFLVVLMGPLQHIWMHFVLLYLLHNDVFSPGLMEYAISYNTALFLFNLLPIYPLDGGKILLLLMSYQFPFQKVIHYTVIISVFFILVGLCITYLFEWMTFHTLCLASFLLVENRLEWKQRQFIFLRHLLARYQNPIDQKSIIKNLKADSTISVYDVMKGFHKGYYHTVHFTSPTKGYIALDEQQCLTAFFEWKKPYESIESVAKLVKT